MGSKETRIGSVEMIVAMLISGTIGWLVVASRQSPQNIVFIRCVFGSATLFAICAFKGMLRPSLFSWRMLGLATLGSATLVWNWILLFAAYSRASISMATAVFNTQPFMLVLLGALVFGEKITLRTVLWLTLAFLGLIMVVRVQPAVVAEPGEYFEGVAYAFGGAFLYAVCSIVTKRLTGTPPHLIALLHTTLGFLMLAPFVDFGHLPTTVANWFDLVVLGVVNTGFLYVLLYGAIQKLPTSMTGALSFIYPISAILVDRVAFGQRLDVLQSIGTILILVAAAGITLGGPRIPEKREAFH